MKGVHIDAEAPVIHETWAVVKTKRKSRKRFPEGCVEEFEGPGEAARAANPAKDLYAARVCGPSRSSEGQRIYYLLKWLD